MVLERLYGRHAVEAALLSRKRNLIKLSLCNTLEHGSRKRPTLEQMQLEKIVQRAADIGVPVERTTRSWLDSMAKDRPHQNLILTAHPLDRKTIQPKELGPGTFVMLDGLKDPQNIGAIMRSAYFLGASGILLHKVYGYKLIIFMAIYLVERRWVRRYQRRVRAFLRPGIAYGTLRTLISLPPVDYWRPLCSHAHFPFWM